MDETETAKVKAPVTVETMVKTQQQAHHERLMVLLNILERLQKIEERLALVENLKRRRVD
jgi:hypothetical protein